MARLLLSAFPLRRCVVIAGNKSRVVRRPNDCAVEIPVHRSLFMRLLRNYSTVLLTSGLLVAAFTRTSLAAPTTTSFTYQGQLKASGQLADGPFEMTFRLFDSQAGANQIGS